MRQDRITLSGLAFACFVYPGIYKDRAYKYFRKKTNPQCDLNNPNHRDALLEFLNKWRCRIAKEAHPKISVQLRSWYKGDSATLFGRNKNLWELNEKDLSLAATAYNSLLEITANYDTRSGKRRPVSIGHPAAAKILFALRPKALPPWDNSIRNKLKEAYSITCYVDYLRHAKDLIGDLREACKKNGFTLNQLPKRLDRPDSTVAKLIDEYYWITITKECPSPDKKTLQRWAGWSN